MNDHPKRDRLHARAHLKAQRLLLSALDRLNQRLTDDGHAGVTRRTSAVGPTGTTRIAIVGCGHVADFYLRTLPGHPELRVVGVMDRDQTRAGLLARRHAFETYPSLEAVLEDERVEVVLNLTNPDSHFEVSKASLLAGKHVYSEKPLAMRLGEAQQLVELAESKNLLIASAPASVLGASAQTLWKALRGQLIGNVRLVYAEMDDGPIHQMCPEEWRNSAGVPWPYVDEFTVGCTMEHAAYCLTWLVAFFGPAKSVTAFSSCLVPDKHPEVPPEQNAPDFSVGCIQFHSGVVARLTCSIVAPRDHSLRIVGDRGVLSVDEGWHDGATVRFREFTPVGFHAESYAFLARNSLTRRLFGLKGSAYPLAGKRSWRHRLLTDHMDFARGVAELAASVREDRPCRLSAQFCLHVNEIALAIQESMETGACYQVKSTCEPLAPMPWAAE